MQSSPALFFPHFSSGAENFANSTHKTPPHQQIRGICSPESKSRIRPPPSDPRTSTVPG